jgi:hypothetical protein
VIRVTRNERNYQQCVTFDGCRSKEAAFVQWHQVASTAADPAFTVLDPKADSSQVFLAELVDTQQVTTTSFRPLTDAFPRSEASVT